MIASIAIKGYVKSNGTVYVRPDCDDMPGNLMRRTDLQHLTDDEFDTAVELMAKNGELVKVG